MRWVDVYSRNELDGMLKNIYFVNETETKCFERETKHRQQAIKQAKALKFSLEVSMLHKLFCFIWDGAWPLKASKIYGKRLLFNDVMRCISNKKCCFFLGTQRNLTWTHFFLFSFVVSFRIQGAKELFICILNAHH